ncbi:MAG: hypothetical protein D6712_13715 [Chloroflexi bacterium]|nr:MAG: hypothetical protein D6712_13715 [Chloroflexota bacterium]
MKRIVFVACLILIAVLSVASTAQDAIPTPTGEYREDAYIGWPPPVYVVRGETTIYGTANVNNMTGYFLEFRPLNDDGTPAEDDAPWFPAVLPVAARVRGDVLGVWDTTTTPDGLYELRLTVSTSDQVPVTHVVSPLRVENEPPSISELGAAPAGGQAPAGGGEQPAQPSVPTPQPAEPTAPPPPPTATQDNRPRVTALVDANVRTGDSTAYPVMGALFNGETAVVLGRSSTGSGWYYIEVPMGGRGFIAPTVVTASGPVEGTPLIDPPPPPATATPTPVPASANLVLSVSVSPHPLVCNQTANVTVTVTNNGTGATTGEAALSVQDILVENGSVQQNAPAPAVPVLQPGQSAGPFVVPITVSTFYNALHRIVVTVDSNGSIPETNENDNTYTTEYVLSQGSCP